MASEVQIANRALQILGAKRITSLTEDSRNARAVNACYETLRDAELRAHPWAFAITRASLAASATAPAFHKERAFPLPSDCLRLLAPDPDYVVNSQDWIVEGREILTNDAAPLKIRYVKRVTDPNEMDTLFRETLSARMAVEMAEEITQSNSKKQDAQAMYMTKIAEARRVNAIEQIAAKPPEDKWVTVRA